MGLTSTAQYGPGTESKDLELELETPPRGIKVRTDLELKIERAGSPLSEREEQVVWPRPVVIPKGRRSLERRKPAGWSDEYSRYQREIGRVGRA